MFCYNDFKAKAWKCHLFLPPFDAKSFNVKSSVIEGGSGENFLALKLIVAFEKHIKELSKKGNLKLHALTRCAKFISTEKRHVIFKGFTISQFTYCPLAWMFHTKQLNNRINSLHEKALRVSYSVMSDIFSLSENNS